jgi:hypothetical protein
MGQISGPGQGVNKKNVPETNPENFDGRTPKTRTTTTTQLLLVQARLHWATLKNRII